MARRLESITKCGSHERRLGDDGFGVTRTKRGRGDGAGARGRRTHDDINRSLGQSDAHTTHTTTLTWHTDWCKAADHSAPGPRGAATLCPGCGAKFAAGDVPPQKDPATGKFPCRVEGCGAEFDSEAVLCCVEIKLRAPHAIT